MLKGRDKWSTLQFFQIIQKGGGNLNPSTKEIRLRVDNDLHAEIALRAKQENASIADLTRSLYLLWLEGHIKFKKREKPASSFQAIITQ